MVFTCPQCGVTFNHQQSLNRHKKTHEGVQFQCNRCEYTTSWRDNFNHHLKFCRRPIEAPPPPSKKVREVEPEPSKLRPPTSVARPSVIQLHQRSVIDPTPPPVATVARPSNPSPVVGPSNPSPVAGPSNPSPLAGPSDPSTHTPWSCPRCSRQFSSKSNLNHHMN